MTSSISLDSYFNKLHSADDRMVLSQIKDPLLIDSKETILQLVVIIA